MFTRICLLLFFLAVNGTIHAQEISVDYRVLSQRGELSRRADITFYCPSENTRNYTLTVTGGKDSINVSIGFKGKKIKVLQKIEEGQRLTETFLLTIDPLSGEIQEKRKVSFSGNELSIKGLSPGNVYRLTYIIKDKRKKKILIPPRVKVGDSPKSGRISFTIPIFFNKGSYNISEKELFRLQKLRPLINTCRVKITGYSDSTKIVKANVKTNEELARLRAISVKRAVEGKSD